MTSSNVTSSNASSSNWSNLKPRPWRRPLALVGLTELGYLLYFHIVVAVPHASPLFPWLPLGRWGFTGPVAAAAAYTACLGGLFALYGLLLQELTRRGESRRDRAVVFWGAALFGLTLVFLPRLLSKDLFDYMAHARVMTVHHANPFTTPAETFDADQFTQAMGWAGATPLYGPAWASIASLLAVLGGGSFTRTVIVFKMFFLLVHLVNGWLVFMVARGWTAEETSRPPRALRAAGFYLWNPLVLTQCVGDAHNDAVVLFWLLLAIWMLQRRDDFLGAACAALSVMVKYITAPVVLLLAIHEWRQKGTLRAAGFVGICAAVAGVAYAPYLSGFNATHFLRPYEHSSYQGSLMMLVEMILGRLIPGGNTPGSPLAHVLLGVTLVAAAGLGIWFLSACFRTITLMDAVTTGTRLLLLYLLVVTALLRTSYLVWIVGLVAVISSATLRRTVALFSCTVLALEVLWVWRILLPTPGPSETLQRFAATAVAVGVPIFYLLLHSRGWPMSRWGRTGGRTTPQVDDGEPA